MRRWVVAAAACLLAGCLGEEQGPPFIGATENVVTAMEHAASWNATARMYAVVGLKPAEANESAEGEPGASMRRLADPDVGDGRAQAWAYVFGTSDQGPWYRIIVDGSGAVAEESAYELRPGTYDEFIAKPLANWSVDSPQAAEAAHANATWADLAGKDGVRGVDFLADADNGHGPSWVLFLMDDAEDQAVVVNAANASLIPAETFLVIKATGPEQGILPGTLNVARPTSTHRFTIERPHASLSVTLSLQERPGGTAAKFTLTGPDGEDVAVDAEHPVGLTASAHTLTLDDPSTGEWTAAVELTDGLQEEFEIIWCAISPDEPVSRQARNGCNP